MLQLVKFHAWANERILDVAARISDHDFRRPAPLDHGTALQTLRHVADVDRSWGEFCAGNVVGESYLWDHGFVLEDLKSIRAFFVLEDTRLHEHVSATWTCSKPSSFHDAHGSRRVTTSSAGRLAGDFKKGGDLSGKQSPLASGADCSFCARQRARRAVGPPPAWRACKRELAATSRRFRCGPRAGRTGFAGRSATGYTRRR